MKKKLTLKLIETNDTPIKGDLVINPTNGKMGVASETTIQIHTSLQHLKVVKPYGISDEEIVTGDYIITPNNEIGKVGYLDREAKLFSTNLPILSDRGCKKVVLQPDQFNYQDIIDLNLKDGDEFLYLYDPFTKAPAKGFTGHAILQSTEYKIEQPVTIDINQCDGCQRGLPKNSYGQHYEIGDPRPIMTCTAYKYKKPLFEPVIYTEEEVRELCRFTYTLGRDERAKSQVMGQYYDTFDQWFNLNKKK